MESRHIDAGGIRMRWEEAGDGPPVVLVHGVPTSPRLWRLVMPLVPNARCIAWEMVGYGESIAEGRNRDLSLSAQAGYLLAFLDRLGISRAVLGGHDLGGGVAQIAAVRRPAVAAGLFFTNCVCYDNWPVPSVKMMRAASGFLRHLPQRLMQLALSSLFYRGHTERALASECLDLHWRPYAAHGGAAALIRQLRALDVRDTLEVVPALRTLRGIPARVVWGAADQFLKVGYGERLAADLDAPLTRLEGGKHFTPEDYPAELAAALRTLVSG